MALYDFSATPLQNIILGIGSEMNAILGKEYSNFNKTRRISDLNLIKVYQDSTDRCVNKAKLDAALAMKETSAQTLLYDDFGRSTPSVGNSLQQTGFGTGRTRRSQIPIGTLLTQKMSVTRENLKQWDFLGSDLEPDILRKKYALALMDAMLEMYMTLLQRTEEAVAAHLVANIAATGGAGTIYANLVNVQEIPLAGATTKYRGIYTEANQNRFLRGDNTTPYLVSSLVDFMNFDALQALGQGNSSDQKGTQLDVDRFNFRQSESLDAIATAAGYTSTSFLIKQGGVGITSYVPDMAFDSIVPEMKIENASFERLEIGDFGAYGIPVAAGIKDMSFGFYMDKSVLNTNGTYGTESSFLDKAVNMTMFTQPIIFAAPSEVAGDTPIVQYGQLSV
jgi:hypothetical protein